MVIRRKSSINKRLYELYGQETMFGYDNIHFKTVNLPKKQKFINLCSNFGLKKINNNVSINLSIIKLN